MPVIIESSRRGGLCYSEIDYTLYYIHVMCMYICMYVMVRRNQSRKVMRMTNSVGRKKEANSLVRSDEDSGWMRVVAWFALRGQPLNQ